MINFEMLSVLLSEFVSKSWITEEECEVVLEAYKGRQEISLFDLEMLVDAELQICSLSTAMDIIETEFPEWE